MIKAKKSLGQNFLTDITILKKITSIVPIKDRYILEVGPGTGNLTSFILKKAPRKLIVVEKDNYLAQNLKETFLDKLSVINKDILEIDETKLSKNKMTVFGNLPYNISTEILSFFATLLMPFNNPIISSDEALVLKSSKSMYFPLGITNA